MAKVSLPGRGGDVVHAPKPESSLPGNLIRVLNNIRIGQEISLEVLASSVIVAVPGELDKPAAIVMLSRGGLDLRAPGTAVVMVKAAWIGSWEGAVFSLGLEVVRLVGNLAEEGSNLNLGDRLPKLDAHF